MILPLLLVAASFQDTAALDRSVAAFTGRPTGAEGGARTPVDARLRLATCPTMSLSWRTEQHDAVVISCAGPAWRIFVPVIRPANAPAAIAASFVPAAKVAPVIKRGDPIVIEAGTEGFSISREGVAMGDAAPGATPATTRAAYAPVIKAEPVIRRGDPIVIEAGTEGFSIRREGVAMGDAAPGGRFLVKVDATRTPVQAIAVEAGRATLPGWSN